MSNISSSKDLNVSTASNEASNLKGKEPVENKEKDLTWYLPLYKAAIRGDWDSARSFFKADPDSITAKITRAFDTALHVATMGRSPHFLKNLVEMMSPESLALGNKGGDTPLHTIASIGNVEAAKLLVNKNAELPNKYNHVGQFPLHFAAMVGHREMVLYLLTVTKEDTEPKIFEGEAGSQLMRFLITSGLYDVALYVLNRHPNLASAHPSPLIYVAQQPSAFPSGTRLNLWQRKIYSCVPMKFENSPMHHNGGDVENPADISQGCLHLDCWIRFFKKIHFTSECQKLHHVLWKVIEILVPHVKHIREIKFMHHQSDQLVKCFCSEVIKLDNKKASLIFRLPFLLGSEFGVHEIVEEILESFPASVSFGDRENHTCFHLAVINRQEKAFNLVYQMGEYKNFLSMLTDKDDNNVMHLAGYLAPKHRLNLVAGAALQMQRELQWFKEVEKFALPPHKSEKNKHGKTPAMLFTESHSELVKEGEQWMKDTANSCTVAAALIATVVFAAAITVPGGNNGDDGIPIFSKQKGFIIFAVFDAISLFSSVSSIVMFLSILTSRYSEADFLYALPNRLIISLLTLFLSMMSLMVAFSSTLFLVFGHKKTWSLIPVATMACLPVTLFVFLQFPLLVDMMKSTYGPGIFRKQGERILL